MDRREAIRRTSMIMGGALSASAIAAVMSGCQATPVAPDWTPEFLDVDQGNLVAHLVERIIPETDTPGARAAGVHHFIDVYLKNCASKQEQTLFMEGLRDVEDRAQEMFANKFSQLEPGQMDEILSTMAIEGPDKSADDQASELANEGEAMQGSRLDPNQFFNGLRQLTILGFFTSEVGATQALIMDPIPGEYLGCIDYNEVGGAWAL